MNGAYRLIALAGAPGAAERRRRAAEFRRDAVRRIWVHKPDHLGDALLARPALAMLRAGFPDAEIVFACSPLAAPLLAGDFHGAEIVAWDSRFLGGDDRIISYLRRARRWAPDLVVNLRHDVRDILLCTAFGGRWLASYDHRGAAVFATFPGAPPRNDRPESANHTALLTETLGLDPAPAPSLTPPPAAQAAAAAWDELRGAGPRVALHAAARTPAKTWPVAQWRGLTRMLAGAGVRRLALLGAAGDRALGAQIAQDNAPVVDWSGRFSVAETAAAVAAADLLIGVDSGLGHLARALGVPVVSLMSGTNETLRWAPDPAWALTEPVACAPCHLHRCPVGGHPCLRGIAPERAFAAAREVLRF